MKHAHLALFLALGLLLPAVATAQDDTTSTGAKVDSLLGRIENSGLERMWDSVAKLEKLGPAAVVDIAKGLGEDKPAVVRLGASKALLVMEGGEVYRPKALGGLKDLLFSKETREVRVMAAELLLSYGGKSDLRALRKTSSRIDDPYVKIAVLKGLRSFGRRALKAFLDSDDAGLRAEAALALGAMGNVEAAKPVLDQLKTEPTDRGRRARMLLEQERMLERLKVYGGLEKKEEILKLQKAQIDRLERELVQARIDAKKAADAGAEGKPAASSSKYSKNLKLLEELLGYVENFYVDGEKTASKGLVDEAAKGMIQSLDPFSSYMTEAETKAFQESIRQSYAGIGAVVQSDPRTGYLTIVKPIYGGPAFEAGLRTLDQVTEVEGISTKGKTVRDLVKVLKGKQGTEVAIKVKHFLDKEQTEKPLAITRDFISLPSVSYTMLPGKIGYVQLSQFGYKATVEVKSAVDALQKDGMIGLILDLRGNPGGLLSAAVQISEMFLPKDKLIVYQQGRKGTRVGRRKEFRSRRDSPWPNFPLVVMINEDSASASEIVSGALKVHGRATLIGRRSFGKGSVQQLYDVKSTEGKSNLRLTIAYYYLPDGTCIHRERSARVWRFRDALHSEIDEWKEQGLISAKQALELHDRYKPTPGGVEPHVDIDRDVLDREVRIKLAELQQSMVVERYVQRHYVDDRETFQKLAVFDNEDPQNYPHFDEIMKEVKNGLTPEQVRIYVRETVRRFVQDDLGRTLPSDFQGDRQLERSIYEVLKRNNVDPATITEYGPLAGRADEMLADEAKRNAAREEAKRKAAEKKAAAEARKKKRQDEEKQEAEKNDAEKKDKGEGRRKDF